VSQQPGTFGQSTGLPGRVAALLLVLAGFVTMATVGLPEPAGFQRSGVLTVGALGASFGTLLLLLPWHRWSTRVSLVLVAPALVLISLHNWYGGQDPFRYSIFFLVVFVWVGTFHPSGTPAAVAIPTLAAYLGPLLAAHASPSALWSVVYAIPLFVAVGEILAWRSTRVGQLEQELRAAALQDALTGLANRRLMVDRLETALARAARNHSLVHVLYVDVDDFKSINDTFGHECGDNVLVTVAKTLQAAVRAADTVARVAGDEFVVLVESADVAAGEQTANRVLDMLRTATTTGAICPVPTVSIGVADSGSCAPDPDELLRAADVALYRAKQAGKDRHENIGDRVLAF
jgi:diguanylate cyclase (GGDEF)-like protein